MDIKDLVESFDAKSAELSKTNKQLQDELKSVGEVSVETKSAIKSQEAALAEIKSQFNEMNNALRDVQAQSARFEASAPGEIKSVGQLVSESLVFKNMRETGNIVEDRVTIEKKDITNLAASAGALSRPFRDPTVYEEARRPMRIRDLIPTISVADNSIEFARLASFTNNAGPQGTTAGIGAGEMQDKNESSLTWQLVTSVVRTIAHWVPASRQVLTDAPMLRGLIDSDLNYGLDLESDDQLLNGDGTGQNILGILNDTDINDAGELPSDTGTEASDIATAMIDHIRKAVRIEQQADYYNMNGILLNPVDWEILETAKASDGHYLMVSMPSGRATETMWRVPVIVTNAIPANSFLIGDWNMGARLYDRESVSIRVSESHASMFIQNGVAVLAEERYTLAIPRPKAFCKGAFTVASA